MMLQTNYIYLDTISGAFMISQQGQYAFQVDTTSSNMGSARVLYLLLFHLHHIYDIAIVIIDCFSFIAVFDVRKIRWQCLSTDLRKGITY